MKNLQPLAICKTASPLKLHAAESCFPYKTFPSHLLTQYTLIKNINEIILTWQ